MFELIQLFDTGTRVPAAIVSFALVTVRLPFACHHVLSRRSMSTATPFHHVFARVRISHCARRPRFFFVCAVGVHPFRPTNLLPCRCAC
eukprot:EW705868.1.p2 GENE.EW705868.1~~EW705868.1.p2  ORF type:complete len:104 (+),score=9.99 EW705868.1:47-313(+)